MILKQEHQVLMLMHGLVSKNEENILYIKKITFNNKININS